MTPRDAENPLFKDSIARKSGHFGEHFATA
jgi:hypothetical protein